MKQALLTVLGAFLITGVHWHYVRHEGDASMLGMILAGEIDLLISRWSDAGVRLVEWLTT